MRARREDVREGQRAADGQLGLRRAETLAPELELIDSRILVPCKDLQDITKKIRKTIVKRDHKVRRDPAPGRDAVASY